MIPHGASYLAIIAEHEVKRANYDRTMFLGSYRYKYDDKVPIDESILKKIVELNDESTILDLF